jgi:type I restriction-modification system DNA methylase subunit
LGIEQHKTFSHWNYFLSIEEDISKLSRWVELSEINYKCYSLEIARLLMTTAAEVDVIAKLICKGIDPQSRAKGIQSYQREIVAEFPAIYKAKVLVPRFGLTLKPWSNWEIENTSPLWWKANNNVKHQRSEFFHEATLKNLLNAVAALLLFLVLYYGEEIKDLAPKSALFVPNSFCVKIGGDWMYMHMS